MQGGDHSASHGYRRSHSGEGNASRSLLGIVGRGQQASRAGESGVQGVGPNPGAPLLSPLLSPLWGRVCKVWVISYAPLLSPILPLYPLHSSPSLNPLCLLLLHFFYLNIAYTPLFFCSLYIFYGPLLSPPLYILYAPLTVSPIVLAQHSIHPFHSFHFLYNIYTPLTTPPLSFLLSSLPLPTLLIHPPPPFSPKTYRPDQSPARASTPAHRLLHFRRAAHCTQARAPPPPNQQPGPPSLWQRGCGQESARRRYHRRLAPTLATSPPPPPPVSNTADDVTGADESR